PAAGPGSDSSGSVRAGSTSDASRSSSSTGSSWSERGGRRGMALEPNETQRMMLSTVARLMDRFPPDYWKGLEDEESYPEAFVREFEAQGFGGLLIPTEYGGAGGALSDAALLLEQSDLMVLVARTTPHTDGAKGTEGLSLFLVDLREAKGIERTRIRTMFNSQTYELFLNDVEVPAGNRIGAEGQGFEPLLHVLN